LAVCWGDKGEGKKLHAQVKRVARGGLPRAQNSRPSNLFRAVRGKINAHSTTAFLRHPHLMIFESDLYMTRLFQIVVVNVG
jgi:hypothetical protein